MGQQQIFLVVLITVIVGIATLVAMIVLDEAQEEANREAVVLDMLNAVPEAQAYYRKHEFMEGGGLSFVNIDMDDFILEASNENGTYAISDRTQASFTLTGIPKGGADPVVLIVYGDSIDLQ